MILRDRTNGTVMTDVEFKNKNKQTSFPKTLTQEVLNSFDVDIVLDNGQPSKTNNQYIVQDGYEQIDGVWYVKWVVVDMTEDQIQSSRQEEAKIIRSKRDKKLAETDWMALSDVTMSDAWAAYRQALRDVTAQEGFPDTVTWPTKPTE